MNNNAKSKSLLVNCLEEKLKNNEGYTIFYSNGCPYCESALEVLKQKTYKGYNFEKNNTSKREILEALRLLDLDKDDKKKLNEHDTKPIIFYKQKFVGGLSELQKYLSR